MRITQNEIEKIALKKSLMQLCIKLIEERIAAIVEAMENAQANANAEEKSSAGDKYETSRAMSHLEKDLLSRQLEANRNELAALFSIDCSGVYDFVKPGSFIRCTDCAFFVAAGLGKLQFEGEDIYLLSPAAPLAKLLYTKKQNDIITLNKKEMFIQELF